MQVTTFSPKLAKYLIAYNLTTKFNNQLAIFKENSNPHTLPQRNKADLVIKVHAKALESSTPKTKFLYSYDLIPQS